MSFEPAIRSAKVSVQFPRTVIPHVATVLVKYPEFQVPEDPLHNLFIEHYCDRIILKLSKKYKSTNKNVTLSFEPADMLATNHVFHEYITKYGITTEIEMLNEFLAVPYIKQISAA